MGRVSPALELIMWLNEFQNETGHRENFEQAIASICEGYSSEKRWYGLAQMSWEIGMAMSHLEAPPIRKKPWGVKACMASLPKFLEDDYLSPKMRQELMESLKEIYQDLKKTLNM